jgi:23S rRNA pseudouridine2605 synthase
VYLALNKPREVVTTLYDPQGRRTVVNLLRGVKERVYPVGRLDYHSEGLLLLTNDGDFANGITSAKSKIPKTYVVKANGELTADQERVFREGIPLSGRRTAPAAIKRISPGANPWYEVKLIEGRQNQIRLMFQHFGLLVERLRRVAIGFLKLDLKPGEFRHLEQSEIERFRRLISRETPAHYLPPEFDSETHPGFQRGRPAGATPLSVRRGRGGKSAKKVTRRTGGSRPPRRGSKPN